MNDFDYDDDDLNDFMNLENILVFFKYKKFYNNTKNLKTNKCQVEKCNELRINRSSFYCQIHINYKKCCNMKCGIHSPMLFKVKNEIRSTKKNKSDYCCIDCIFYYHHWSMRTIEEMEDMKIKRRQNNEIKKNAKKLRRRKNFEAKNKKANK